MNKRLFSFFFLWLIFSACQSDQDTDLQRAFYHWKSTFDLASFEQVSAELGLQKLYVRAFDVDWDSTSKNPVPLGQITNPANLPKELALIPCIFITNRTFKNLKEEDLDLLVERVWQKLQYIFPQMEKIQEIQFDCDWTQTTESIYFNFLQAFKQKSRISLSATIRLHQIRYADQTGIPPVDRGMLMFYNMGELQSWEEKNSILNIEKARPYLIGADRYSLPLDLALPIFSWGVIFREGKMIKLIHKIPEHELKDTSRFSPLEDLRFRVKKSTYLEGLYLYQDDLIRLEKIEADDLQEAIKLNSSLFKKKAFTLSLYHLDTTFIKQLSYDQIKVIFQSFH